MRGQKEGKGIKKGVKVCYDVYPLHTRNVNNMYCKHGLKRGVGIMEVFVAQQWWQVGEETIVKSSLWVRVK